MPAYMSRGAGVLLAVRTEHYVGLRDLTLALYQSNEQLGDELTSSAVRKAIAGVLRDFGTNVITKVSDYIGEAEEFDDGHLVGSTTGERLDWARRMVTKAYCADFKEFPEELVRFKALSLEELA